MSISRNFSIFFTDIREWLKSLRLHKYTKLILEYTYEEFLDLTDETLEKRNVTLGARGKIIKNIGLVKYRPQKLKEMAKELEVIFKSSGQKNSWNQMINQFHEIYFQKRENNIPPKKQKKIPWNWLVISFHEFLYFNFSYRYFFFAFSGSEPFQWLWGFGQDTMRPRGHSPLAIKTSIPASSSL